MALHQMKGKTIQFGLAVCLAATCWLATGCQMLVQQANHKEAMMFMEHGHAFLEEGLTDSALAAFGMALEADPDLFDAHMGMGHVYHQHEQYELAARAYKRATHITPNSFDAWYHHGWMVHLAGDLLQAVDSYLRALSIMPDNFEANHNLAGAYLQLGRPDDALPYAKRATEISPLDQSAWSNLATTHSVLEQHEQAVEAYREAVELGEMAQPILLGLANELIRLGRYDQAINVLDSINRSFPSAQAYERIGYAQFKLRQFSAALISFRETLILDHENTLALNGAGVCLMAMYLQNGRNAVSWRDEALASWRRSLQIRPEQPHIADLLTRYQRM